jgi:NitT/TauT family transport system permease protein/taurine transport system permease protein
MTIEASPMPAPGPAIVRSHRILSNPVVKTAFPFAVVIGLWAIVAELGVFPPAFFVGPGQVYDEAVQLVRKGILPAYLGDSSIRLLSGALTGLVVGIPLGYLIGLNKYVRRALWPLLLFFQAIADIAWLPLLIVWFGFSLTSVNFVIVYAIIFPLILSIVAGIDGVPEDLVRAARSLGASRRQVLTEVVIPGSLAAATTGIRTGLGYGWRALVAAEIIVGTSGIGFMMFDARRAGQVAAVFLGMIILGILWYAVDALILARLERQTVERWGIVKRVGQ